MSDIEKLLAAASDDADQPLRHSVDDIVRRGRRSVRHRRIATATTVTLTTAAIVGGLTAWAGHTPRGAEPAGSPTHAVTIDADTGKPIAPAPPVSPLSDRTIIEKCMALDKLPTWDPKPWNKPGSLSHRWQVAVKSGGAHTLKAILIAPDRSVGAYCQLREDAKAGNSGSYGRFPVTDASRNGTVFQAGYADGLKVPANVSKILVDVPGEAVVRQALVGTDGFYTLGALFRPTGKKPGIDPGKPRIRGYAADGSKIVERELPLVVALPPIPER